MFKKHALHKHYYNRLKGFKGAVDSKVKIRSSFTHPYVVPNLSFF